MIACEYYLIKKIICHLLELDLYPTIETVVFLPQLTQISEEYRRTDNNAKVYWCGQKKIPLYLHQCFGGIFDH